MVTGMSRYQVIGKLKKLLACNKRQYTVGDDSSSTHSSTDSDKCGGTSPDSMTCQPRLTLRELRRRRHHRVSMETWSSGTEGTESPKTLSGGSLTTEYNVARVQQKLHLAHVPGVQRSDAVEGIGMLADRPVTIISRSRRAVDKFQHAGRLQQRDFQADICVLDSCDHRCQVNEEMKAKYAVARPDDLIVTDYLPAVSFTSEQNPKIMNSVLLCYQCQLNSDMCDVGTHRTNSSTLKSSELDIHLTTRLSNEAVFQPSSCNSTRLNACRRSILMVQKMSDMSEPISVCASMTSSEEQRIKDSACWPTGDAAATAPESAISPSAVDANTTVDTKWKNTPENEKAPNCLESANVAAQTNGHVENAYSPSHAFQTCPMCRMALPKVASCNTVYRDRLGVMSTELFLSLCDLSSGADLVERYLGKRQVTETTRVRHEQRCGRMREDLLQKIITASAASATVSGNMLFEEATSLTYKSASTLSSSGFPDIGWSHSQFKDAPKSAASTAMAEPVLTRSSAVGFGLPEYEPEARSPQEKRKARMTADTELSTNFSRVASAY